MFLGLRSLIYPAPDIAEAKAWYTQVLGVEPYFDQEAYVGFDVCGFELGLFRFGNPDDGPRTYMGVDNIDEAMAQLLAAGATIDEEINDVGDGIRMGSVRDPLGQHFGVIENPVFVAKQVDSPGPGR